MSADNIQKMVIVTGPSGAGRSTAIAALADMGYEVIDNMPLRLIPRLLSGQPLAQPLALGVDARTRDFSPAHVLAMIEDLGARGTVSVELLYLDCQPEVLLRRFSETRRRHPLAPSGSPEDGIREELALMVPLRTRADILVDTSGLSPHQLRQELSSRLKREDGAGLAVSVQSFSFKRGAPRGLDMVFDVRFLRNPHWDTELRPLTGLEPEVAAYIGEDPMLARFEEQLFGMAQELLPAFEREGKSYLAIGIGCTGGQHRSVLVAEKLGKVLAEAGWQVSTRHRELSRRASSAAGHTSRGKSA